MSEISKEANLARVRDNQRRSRARRKEYLSELESKYQNCERTGVEANAEIQAAARLVLADNKRLRAMLKSMGVSDAEIDGSGINAASPKKLEIMLSQRKACGGGGTVSPAQSQRLSPVTGVQPIASAPPQPSLDSPAFEMLDRWSDGGRMLATGMNQALCSQQQPSLQPRAPAQRPTPPQSEEQQEPPAFEALNRWSDGSRIHATGMNQLLGEQQQPPHTQTSAYATPEDTISTSSGFGTRSCAPSNSKSCYEVADTIRMMHPDIGDELEVDMGCGQDGGECSVSNLQAFDVLDRWSDGSRVFAMGLPEGS